MDQHGAFWHLHQIGIKKDMHLVLVPQCQWFTLPLTFISLFSYFPLSIMIFSKQLERGGQPSRVPIFSRILILLRTYFTFLEIISTVDATWACFLWKFDGVCRRVFLLVGNRSESSSCNWQGTTQTICALEYDLIAIPGIHSLVE